MGVEERIDEILRAGDDELPSHEDLNNPVFWMKCLRSAYYAGYESALAELEPLTPVEAHRYEREHWARLPVP